MNGGRRLGLWAAMAATAGTLASCATLTPIVFSAPQRPDAAGLVTTTIYTGSLASDDGRCRGAFGDATDGSGATRLQVNCSDGRHGVGTATLDGGRFLSGRVRLNDGATLVVRTTGPSFP